jgi:hypothetical protein
MRIQEIETFYANNINDLRANNFLKTRLRLKKLLDYDMYNLPKNENVAEIIHNISVSKYK